MEQNQDKRNSANLRATQMLEFNDLCAVRLFTADTSFCNEFQTDQRNHNSGCKWNFFRKAFQNALFSLHFAQKMGRFETNAGIADQKANCFVSEFFVFFSTGFQLNFQT